MIVSSSSKSLVLPLIVLAGIVAQGPRQVPKFAGKTIPDPPRQKEPWTPPRTQLPRFLVTATSALFEQGMADPRGCEYREVEIVEWRTFRTRAFVLPEKPGESFRFAVSWDGVIGPVSSVGPAADLDADIRALTNAMRRDRANFAPKLCILLRFGRADLAELLFAAGTTWTPEIRGRDLTDYHISYLTLARQWAVTMFERLVDAHMRADDAIALDAARRLSAFAKAAQTRAMEMGFEREQTRFGNDGPVYFPFLRQLPELLADHERRAIEGARGPTPPHGADPAARVAALIRDLDEIAHPQMVHFGNRADDSPLVQALVAEGDEAVEPLLAAIETDTRLTRTVTEGRGMSIDRKVHPVFEPEFAALTGILKTQQFTGQQYQVEAGTLSRKDLARSMRDFWIKNRTMALTERWYRTLRDDSSGYSQWWEAAAGIVQPTNQVGPAVQGSRGRTLEPSAPPMKGEELRSRRDPSVSELLARRVLEIARAPRQRTIPDRELDDACRLALLLDRWDPKAALPVIRALMTQAREVVDRDRSEGDGGHYGLMVYIVRFSLIRARAGEPAALAEYAAEIRHCDPEKGQPRSPAAFEPMWTYPDDPAVREAAHWLFNNPASAWAAILRKPGSNKLPFSSTTRLYALPLLRSAGFRDAVLDAMASQSELGTLRRTEQTVIQYELKDRNTRGFRASEADLEGVAQGVDRSFRACDYIAWQVSTIEGGAPVRAVLDEGEARRGGRGVCGVPENLRRSVHGRGAPGPERARTDLRGKGTPGVPDPRSPRDEGGCPRGPGNLLARRGRRDPPGRFAVDTHQGEADPSRGGAGECAEDGWVWQAEEVRRDGQWERYYGFVGRHVIARVPSSSIELAGGRKPAPGDR